MLQEQVVWMSQSEINDEVEEARKILAEYNRRFSMNDPYKSAEEKDKEEIRAARKRREYYRQNDFVYNLNKKIPMKRDECDMQGDPYSEY